MIVAAQQLFGAKILRLRCTAYSFAQDDMIGRLIDKLEFDISCPSCYDAEKGVIV